MPKHILHAFEDSLQTLKQAVMTMASHAQRMLSESVRGLLERDNALCNKVIADDDEVDQLEVQVDRDGVQIIMKYSPVAADLRRVMMTIKVGQQLERVADEAVNIARRARTMNQHAPVQETALIQAMYDLAAAMLRDAVTSYNEGNLRLALGIEVRDQELDRRHAELIKSMVARAVENASQVEDYLDLIFIVRFLERIGDHAVNIAEDTVYAESAYDIRHGGERPQIEASA
ncbi:MAG: phosphate signaling complex protein PhoU [Verrucomicrobiales bacterium]